MSEEIEVKIGEGLEVTKEKVEIISDVDPNEVRARAQGWVPKEEFRGEAERWIDARSFVERGETILPIMRERNERLEKEIRGMKKSFEEFSEFHRQTAEKAYQKALKEIEQRKLGAVERADTEEYKDAELERVELEKSKPVPKVEKVEGPPELQEFQKSNAWYGIDRELTDEADALGGAYIKQGIPYSKMLEKVQETIKKLHPEKFTNIRRDGVSLVESVSSETGLPKKGNSRAYENLPAEAKAQCDKWIKSGLLTKEQYIRDYQWE